MSWVFTLLGATWQIGGTISGLLAMAVVAINYQGIELWR